MALNLRGLYGPEVDRALGGEEPMVDEWESGVRYPLLEQLFALAELTDLPPAFFAHYNRQADFEILTSTSFFACGPRLSTVEAHLVAAFETAALRTASVGLYRETK